MLSKKQTGTTQAYSQDPPGCVATGSTREEVEQNMYDAIVLLMKGLIEDDAPVPVSQAFFRIPRDRGACHRLTDIPDCKLQPPARTARGC